MKNLFFGLFFFLPLSAVSQVDFSDELIISTQNIEPVLVIPADMNSDENVDVLSISGGDNTVGWFENLDGSGAFSGLNLISSSYQIPSCIAAADFDGDSYLDIVVSYYVSDRVIWFRNIDGNGTFEEQSAIDNARDGAFHVSTADIDSDGDEDVFASSWEDDTFAWYENLDGMGNFSSANILSNNASKACRIVPADIDLDGDADIITGTNYINNEIFWFENTDGSGTFLQREIITTAVDNLLSIWVCDLDNDGDFDVLSASTEDNKTAWYENLDGNGTFGDQQIISTDTEDAFQVSTADLDNDDDEDVIVSCGVWNRVVYFLNEGNGNFSEMNNVWEDAEFVHSTLAADFDNDDDQDLVSAFWGSNKIVWFRNEFYTGIDEELQNPYEVRLLRNYPNPFNPSTTITFTISSILNERYELGIYNSKGQKVRSFSNQHIPQSADNQFIWDGTDSSNQPVSSGVYYAVLSNGGNALFSRKMILMK